MLSNWVVVLEMGTPKIVSLWWRMPIEEQISRFLKGIDPSTVEYVVVPEDATEKGVRDDCWCHRDPDRPSQPLPEP